MVVPLAPGSTWKTARPVGIYEAPPGLVRQYLRDR